MLRCKLTFLGYKLVFLEWVPGMGLGCKSRRLKKGKPPEMLGIGSSWSGSPGDHPKCELASVIGAGALTGMLM